MPWGMETELERGEARLAAARRKLAELTSGPAEPELVAEIERAHQQVEALERKVRGAKLSALALRTRQQLKAAQAVEQELLTAYGFDSWLGYQLRRIEHLLYQPSAEEVVAAELEHRRALASWQELAAMLQADAEAEAAAQSVEVERRPSTIGPWPTGWSALPI
jgi:hypothetical protein